MSEPTDRNRGLGGSDISVVVGLNPFKSPYELYLEKRGELPAKDIAGKQHIVFGHLFEEPVAEGYCIVRGAREGREIKVRRVNATQRHPAVGWMMAHPDRVVVGEHRGLECKNVGAWTRREEWGPDGSDIVPDYMFLQVQQYMAVTGYGLWDLAALHGGNDLRIYSITSQPDIIAGLIDAGNEFWSRVEQGNPPDVDWTAHATRELLQRMYPGTSGVTLNADPALFKWHEIRAIALDQVKHYQGIAEGATNHLLMALGEGAMLRFADGSGYTRKRVKRKGYTVEETEYWDFRFNKTLREQKE